MRHLLPLGCLLMAGCAASFSNTVRWAEYYAGMEWLYDPEQTTLYYGVDESDHIALAFECASAGGDIVITYFSMREQAARKHDRLVFGAGDQRWRLTAQGEDPRGNESYDYWIFTAAMPAYAFRASAGHRIAVGINRLTESPVDPLPPAMAAKLADACAAKRAGAPA